MARLSSARYIVSLKHHQIQESLLSKRVCTESAELNDGYTTPTQRTNAQSGVVLVEYTSFNDLSASGFYMSTQCGGAMFVSDANVTVNNSRFTNCFAMYGGAIAVTNCNFMLQYSSFEGNVANESIGAVWIMDCSPCLISRSNFTNNTALHYFGTIAANYTQMKIEYCYFINNSAQEGCTAIALENSNNSNITACNFKYTDMIPPLYVEYSKEVRIRCCSFPLNSNVSIVKNVELFHQLYAMMCTNYKISSEDDVGYYNITEVPTFVETIRIKEVPTIVETIKYKEIPTYVPTVSVIPKYIYTERVKIVPKIEYVTCEQPLYFPTARRNAMLLIAFNAFT